MKKVYEAPAVEKIAFQYRDQVVVASGVCHVTSQRGGDDGNTCIGGTTYTDQKF